jgi:hypothetical protein
MATTAEDSYYVIERGGSKKKIYGLDLKDKLETGDILLLNRDGQLQTFKWGGPSSIDKIKDTDHFVCWHEPHSRNYRVRGSKVKEMMTPAIPKVEITRWDWPTNTQNYGTEFTGYWATKHAEKLDREGYKIYANFGGDTASGSDTWRVYSTETKYHSITGKAYSKYDDSTVSTQAWVWVTGFSINPCTIFDHATSGMVGGAFRPKVSIPNEDKIYKASGTEMSTTWKLLGMTKGNEEASFGSTSNQINETRDREPRVVFKKKTRNGPITLQCEVINTDTWEYARPEIKFTVGM